MVVVENDRVVEGPGETVDTGSEQSDTCVPTVCCTDTSVASTQ